MSRAHARNPSGLRFTTAIIDRHACPDEDIPFGLFIVGGGSTLALEDDAWIDCAGAFDLCGALPSRVRIEIVLHSGFVVTDSGFALADGRDLHIMLFAPEIAAVCKAAFSANGETVN